MGRFDEVCAKFVTKLVQKLDKLRKPNEKAFRLRAETTATGQWTVVRAACTDHRAAGTVLR